MGRLKEFCTDDQGEIHPEWLEDKKRVEKYLKERNEPSKDSKKIRVRKPQTVRHL